MKNKLAVKKPTHYVKISLTNFLMVKLLTAKNLQCLKDTRMGVNHGEMSPSRVKAPRQFVPDFVMSQNFSPDLARGADVSSDPLVC
jgi:hypothetical protein